ncbi:MAG: 1-acyl-sn-glycerol-3-phosphate acyltransferase [Armatimonadetes bacterium]|nr:1-acyl-sn-glycerol-3-phosphate acyltransferase [Armatimonadota bacterium]
MDRPIFLAKAVLAALWFGICSAAGLGMSLLRWKDPSCGHDFARMLSPPLLRLFGIQLSVEGEERLHAAAPCVYVANHQSNLDVVFFGMVYPPRTLLIGKRELMWIPFFGLMFAAMGNVLMDRRDSKRCIDAMSALASRMPQQGLCVWIFPEGHRNQGGPLLPFKKGAFHLAADAGVPLVPLVLGPIRRVVDPSRMRCPGGRIELKVLEPIPSAGREVPELMAEARQRMEQGLALLNRPAVEARG